MNNSKGRQLHEQAAKTREAGDFIDSLTLNDQAQFAYDVDNDSLGFAEGIACRSITLRVYASQHDSRRLLTLAKYEMMASVAIARDSGIKEALALPLYNLAQLQEDLGEFSEAVEIYKEAVTAMQNNPPERHNRPSVLANMRVHLETCAYKAGDKAALDRAEVALGELEKTDEKPYEKDVWVSGGYMRMADILRTDNPEKAKASLEKAKVVIDGNPELVLRRQQWEKLAETFS